MADLTLVIGNKNYSSWSLRPWLALKQAEIAFEENRIALYRPESREKVLRYSPTGKVPVLCHGELVIWESLAICEYIAEQFAPQLYPSDRALKAIARSVSHEMHAGFAVLREQMPMNIRERIELPEIRSQLRTDIERVCEIWRDFRANYGQGGDFLFGSFIAIAISIRTQASRYAPWHLGDNQTHLNNDEFCF
jgi:glutathione S-transferase